MQVLAFSIRVASQAQTTAFQSGFRTLIYKTFCVELPSVIFIASSSMVDASPMCVCPCNPTSLRSQSTPLLYHSTSGGASTSSTSKKSSPLFYILTTTATSTTSASAALGSSVCYCPCSTTSSASYLLCKYSYRNRLACIQNVPEKSNENNALSVGTLRVM